MSGIMYRSGGALLRPEGAYFHTVCLTITIRSVHQQRNSPQKTGLISYRTTRGKDVNQRQKINFP